MSPVLPGPLEQEELIAAVDLGSNSFHLVIARIIDGALQILHREKQKVLLAAGLDEQHCLSDEAMNRGLAVLSQFADTLAVVPTDAVRVIATFTLRRAKNRALFLERAAQIFPYPIEVIPGQEEARFIYQGVAHFEHFEQRRLVIDIGGGSTEFAIGQHFQPLRLASRNMGCVSFAELYFPNGRLSERRFARALLHAEQEVEAIVSSYREAGWQQVVGTSGTIKTIFDVIEASGWHAHAITLPHLLQLRRELLKFDDCNKIVLPGLTEDRLHLIAPGLAILLAAFQMLGIEEMRYVDAALREGVLYEMSDRLHHQDIRLHTIESLKKRYVIDEAQALRVSRTCQQLWQQTAPNWGLSAVWLEFLQFAAQLFEIGLQINSAGVQRHSAYILNNTNLPGFNQEQQRVLAALVRFHRRKIKLDDIPDLYLYKRQDFLHTMVLFRLAVLLNQKRRDDAVPEFQITSAGHQLNIQIAQEWYQAHQVLAADLHSERLFLRKVGIQLQLHGVAEPNSDD